MIRLYLKNIQKVQVRRSDMLLLSREDIKKVFPMRDAGFRIMSEG